MVKYLTYGLILLIAACNTVNVDDLADAEIAISAVVIANEPVKGVKVNYLTTLNGHQVGQPVIDAQVFISAGGAEIALSHDPNNPGTYFDENEVLTILPNATVLLRVLHKDERVTAIAEIPPVTDIISISATTIPIDEFSLGQPVFSVLWTQVEGYSRVLTLEEPVDADLIPFSVPAGQFQAQYRLPLAGQGATLYDVDFAFYGSHTLSVITIDEEYDALFFSAFDALDQNVNNGFDNIEGGAGYFAGATKTTIDLELIEN